MINIYLLFGVKIGKIVRNAIISFLSGLKSVKMAWHWERSSFLSGIKFVNREYFSWKQICCEETKIVSKFFRNISFHIRIIFWKTITGFKLVSVALHRIVLCCGVFDFALTCIILYCIVALCCVVLYCIVLYFVVLCCLVLCLIELAVLYLYCIAFYCIVFCCVLLSCIVLYLYCICIAVFALHCIVLCCAVLCCVVLSCLVLSCLVLSCACQKRVTSSSIKQQDKRNRIINAKNLA